MKHWIVKKASVNERSGLLHVFGDNLFTGTTFHWDIGAPSLQNVEYDFSGCAFTDEAKALYEQLLATAGER